MPNSPSIVRRLTLMNLLVSAFALLLAGSAFLTYDQITARRTLEQMLSAQARIIAENTASAITFNDPAAAQATLSALQSSPNVLGASIFTADGRRLARYSRDMSEPGPAPTLPPGQSESYEYRQSQVVISRAVMLDGKPIGSVTLRAGTEYLWTRLLQYLAIGLIVLGLSLAIALFVSNRFRDAIANPIIHLAEVARTVSRHKNYAVRAEPVTGTSEVAALVAAFNEMLAQIEQQNADLRDAQTGLERKVEDRTRQLVAANRELEAFSYSVSHDLRNPLDALNSLLFILNTEYTDKLGAHGLELVRNMQGASRRMAELIEDLLNLARVNTTVIHPETLDLGEIAKEVAAGLSRREPARSVRFVSSQCETVQADRRMLQIVLENLLGNAWKYTSRRDRAEVEFGCERRDGQTVFFVRDNGAGFDPKAADRLFQPFQRLHPISEFPGSGIGLATVQRIVARHGGDIWAQAKPGEGATFYFTLGAAARTSLAQTG